MVKHVDFKERKYLFDILIILVTFGVFEGQIFCRNFQKRFLKAHSMDNF